MNRGTASVVQLGKGVTAGSFSGLNVLTNVILGKKEALQKDFNGLVLTDLVMLGKKISHITIITVTVGPAVSPLLLPDAITDSLTYVKAYGGTEQRDIPDDYLQRQFIYMMDGSYLLTDIVPTYDCKVEMDFATTSLNSQGYVFLGGRSAPDAGSGIQFYCNSTNTFIADGFGTRYTSSVTAVANTRYKYTYNNQIATLESGGSTLFTTTYTTSGANTAALALNAMNNNGSIQGNTVGIYLYSFKVWNAQGELVANYVPAVQKGTVPVVGFYDTVNKTFKAATAGTFAAGGEAVPTPNTPMDIVSNNGVLKARHQSGLPLGYTLLDYIESSGTQYIDTNITGSTNAIIDMQGTPRTDDMIVFMLAPINATAYKNGFGQYRGQIAGASSLDVATTRRVYNVSYTSNSMTVNGVNVGDRYIANNVNLALFGSTATNRRIRGAKLYSAKIYNNNTLVRDFIPAKNSSGVVGLYDLADANPSTAFYINAGTGVFDEGDPVSDPVEIYTDGTVETIKDSLNNTATAEMLLKVGDYTDVQEILSGAVTRKIGIKVLNGTEDWVYSISLLNYMYTLRIDDLYAEVSSVTSRRKTPYCTHFVRSEQWVTSSAESRNNVVQAWRPSSGSCVLGLGYNYPSANGLADFKAWLAEQYAAGTPVIVVYPLATPTTESVTGQTLQVAQGDNTLEITQASIDGLELEAQYEQGVQASVQEIEP